MNMYFQNNGTEILDRWQSTDKPGNGSVPIIQSGRGSFLNLEADGSSRWVEKGDFLKLQNISFGYTLPKNIVNSLTLSNVRVYLQAQNLLTVTGYSGLDPEVYTTTLGVDWNGNPQQRSFTFGLSVVF
jgi:hypothetical protein